MVRLAIDVAMQTVGGKYKCWILYYLSGGTRRTKELLALVQGISQKVLTEQLRQLEKDGLIMRTVYPEVPPRVEYALTETGRGFVPVLKALCVWGKDYAESQGQAVASCTVFD